MWMAHVLQAFRVKLLVIRAYFLVLPRERERVAIVHSGTDFPNSVSYSEPVLSLVLSVRSGFRRV